MRMPPFLTEMAHPSQRGGVPRRNFGNNIVIMDTDQRIESLCCDDDLQALSHLDMDVLMDEHSHHQHCGYKEDGTR